MAKDQAAEATKGETPAKVEKKPAKYNIFVTDDQGATLTRVNDENGAAVVVEAPTSDRARRDGARRLLVNEGDRVNVVAVSVKSLTVDTFGIERPEPKLTAVK
jgi:hypothetical protein